MAGIFSDYESKTIPALITIKERIILIWRLSNIKIHDISQNKSL
jgi:hypothetical protein